MVPFACQKILVQPGWYLPSQKILLAENKFLKAGKGAENTKEKSRQCFSYTLCAWFCTYAGVVGTTLGGVIICIGRLW